MSSTSSISALHARHESQAPRRASSHASAFFFSILKPLASLRLTVVLLVLAMILIYAGTWAQLDTGIWEVQKHYFHSLFCWIPFQTFFPRPKPGQFHIPGGFPMLGGYLLGLLLLVNLIAAHVVRFKFTWKRLGIILIHLGLILLLVGEGISSSLQVESQMTIDIGASTNYSQDIRTVELAVIDPSNPDHDDVAAIPASMIRTGATIHHSALPVDLSIDQFFPNSNVLGPMQQRPPGVEPRATTGIGKGITVLDAPPVSGTDSDQVDAPSAYVTLTAGSQKVGTYLVSVMPLDLPGRAPLDSAQEFTVNGKLYKIQLRFKRIYHPFTVQLLDFRHDKYLGTEIPKDFSSRIRLIDPTRNVDREVRIWMNNPLRYAGLTFYQQGFKQGDRTTILQVVRNPAWLMPYFACAIGALGLFLHFTLTLLNFLRKRLKTSTTKSSAHGGTPVPGSSRLSPATFITVASVLAIYFITVTSILRPTRGDSSFDYETFSTLPVSYEGRIQPLDSLARNSLKILSGRESATVDDKPLPAIDWLADMFGRPEKAADYPVIRIDHPGLVGLLGLDPQQKRYSFNQILKSRDKLQEQLTRAQQVPPKEQDLFQRRLSDLGEKLSLYVQLGQMESLYLIPPPASAANSSRNLAKPVVDTASTSWQPLGHSLAETAVNPVAQTWLNLITALHDNQPADFNHEVASYAKSFEQKFPTASEHVQFEAFFNRVDPFLQCIILYIVAFICAALSWVIWNVPFRRAAIIALGLALVIHTLGLASRVYISGRPPVTNLASSAIFIAWGAVVLSIGMELVYRTGIGSATAALLGFLSLLIADRLALSGDTMKVLQAVLDTNYWLATHVVMITLGYSATFLAGFIAILFVIGSLFHGFDKEQQNELGRMIYGITCFAVLFSFIGTILGGIWADQSWGRFWGWDPKENGAVLIVLCNALLLHARWAGLVKARGIACLAIFGNIVTSWSWFGVNMLGVGLHSYGFMESALLWLLLFVASQVLLIALAFIPAPAPAPSPA